MDLLLNILAIVSCVICMGGSILLFQRPNKTRAHYILSWLMLVWGLFYFSQILALFLTNDKLTPSGAFSPEFLVLGNLFVILVMFYLIEMVRPRWLSLKRAFLILLPYFIIVLIFGAVIEIKDEDILSLNGFSEIREHLSEFNVWYRLVIFFSVIVYLLILHIMIYHSLSRYKKWVTQNNTSVGNMGLAWINFISLGFFSLTFTYSLIILEGSPITLALHHLAIEIFFSYLIYQGLYHQNPYPDGFFVGSWLDDPAVELNEEKQLRVSPLFVQPGKDDALFQRNIPVYVERIKEWMEEEKPYKKADFHLLDVMQVLPLNRTYLSRVFSEGFGNTFSNIVEAYRVQEAEFLLREYQDLNHLQISHMCGFPSPTAFQNVFMKHYGMTPLQYRRRVKTS